MKVGIDLSSTNTGLVILEDNNKLIDKKVFNLWKDNKIDFDEICKLSNFIYDAWNVKANYDVEKLETTYIGIELADFKNANYTNRFNRICGALEFDFWEAPYDYECKIFNSNEWQRFLLDIYKPYIQHYTKQNKKIIYRVDKCDDYVGIYKHTTLMVDTTSNWLDKRGLLKLLSRMWTHKNCKEYDYGWTEDECDAYCIAYFLQQLRDRTQMHQEVKVRKINKAKSEKQALRDKLNSYRKAKKLYEIVNHYKDIASVKKLTKAQQRALEKAEMELKEYEKN